MADLLNPPATMSSVEIAELTGKRHDNVMRDAKTMLDDLGIAALIFEGSYKGGNGKALPLYNLPRRECLILVSGYSVELRARIIDRWEQLERQTSNVTFLVPKTLPEALRLAANLAEENERQKSEIATMQPKAAFADAVAEAVNCQTVQEIAKIIGTGQNRLFDWLRKEGLLMADNQPYQKHIDAGHFRLVERSYTDKRGERHTYTRTLVTGLGLQYIQRRFENEAA